jgi:hypothetical protein
MYTRVEALLILSINISNMEIFPEGGKIREG